VDRNIFDNIEIGDEIIIQMDEFPNGGRPSKEKPQKQYTCIVRYFHKLSFDIDRITKYGKEFNAYDYNDIVKWWKEDGKLYLVIYDSLAAFGRNNMEINRQRARLSQRRNEDYDDRWHEADLQWRHL